MAVRSSAMVTMDDIAKRAGVSRATVSYVLNKRKRSSGTISEETSARVILAAKELNYRTNELAKAMVSGKSKVLGILTSSSNGEVHFQILTGIARQAEEAGYLVKIMHLAYYGADKSVVERCQKWMIAGVIVFGLSHEDIAALREGFAAAQIPFALLDDHSAPARGGTVVRSDDAQGIGMAVRHLASLGHHRIALLGGSPSLLTLERAKLFKEAMAEAKLVVSGDLILTSDWLHIDLIRSAANELLSMPNGRPTAIICAGDPIAMVVLGVARKMDLHVPQDLSVIGFSNSSACLYSDPPLSSIDQGFTEMGTMAASRVIAAIESNARDHNFEEVLCPTRLLVRESTLKPSIASHS